MMVKRYLVYEAAKGLFVCMKRPLGALPLSLRALGVCLEEVVVGGQERAGYSYCCWRCDFGL